MTNFQPVFFAVVFVIVALICYLVLRQLLPTALDKRVEALGGAHPDSSPRPGVAASLSGAVARWLTPFARPSLPKGAWEKSPLRLRF